MKPTRNFVVEFKSNRRRAPSQAASIWGDTDLKAIKREVEDLSPHLFAQAHPLTVAGDLPSSASPEGEIAPVSEVAVTDAPAEVVEIDPTEASSTHGLASLETAEPPADEPLAPQEERIATAPGHLGGDSRRKLRKAPSRTQFDAKQSQPDGTSVERPLPLAQDELIVLEQENRRLKALLCTHLETENATLREMLARCS